MNELDCSSTSSHTILAGDSVESTDITCKISNSISCVLDVDQNSDTDGEEHLQEQQIFHTTRRIGEQKAKNLHPTVTVPERSEALTQIVDPTANAYNYSMDSREYVLVSSLSYSGGSESTTFTTIAIANHHEDSCTQHLSHDNTLS